MVAVSKEALEQMQNIIQIIKEIKEMRGSLGKETNSLLSDLQEKYKKVEKENHDPKDAVRLQGALAKAVLDIIASEQKIEIERIKNDSLIQQYQTFANSSKEKSHLSIPDILLMAKDAKKMEAVIKPHRRPQDQAILFQKNQHPKNVLKEATKTLTSKLNTKNPH